MRYLNHNKAENPDTPKQERRRKPHVYIRGAKNGEFNRYLVKLEDDLRAPQEQTIQLAGTTRRKGGSRL
jgi:hypothetical protein